METTEIITEERTQVIDGNTGTEKTIIKRTRKPWVYKEDYDLLKLKHQNLKAVAAVGYILALLITIAWISVSV